MRRPVTANLVYIRGYEKNTPEKGERASVPGRSTPKDGFMGAYQGIPLTIRVNKVHRQGYWEDNSPVAQSHSSLYTS